MHTKHTVVFREGAFFILWHWRWIHTNTSERKTKLVSSLSPLINWMCTCHPVSVATYATGQTKGACVRAQAGNFSSSSSSVRWGLLSHMQLITILSLVPHDPQTEHCSFHQNKMWLHCLVSCLSEILIQDLMAQFRFQINDESKVHCFNPSFSFLGNNNFGFTPSFRAKRICQQLVFGTVCLLCCKTQPVLDNLLHKFQLFSCNWKNR